MLTGLDQTKVYFAREPSDMRKQIDGLALQVQEILQLDPFSPHIFAFCNKSRDKVKLLYWHSNGFCLLYKRLEKGRFSWPGSHDTVAQLTLRELNWLLEGHALSEIKPRKALRFVSI